MKKNFFIALAMVAVAMLSSCNGGNTIHANYSEIVLTPGETVTVELDGDLNGYKPAITNVTYMDPEYGDDYGPVYGVVDSAFVVSNIKRRSVDVTGYKIGCDTLKINYGAGMFNNGAFVSIPVSCIEK